VLSISFKSLRYLCPDQNFGECDHWANQEENGAGFCQESKCPLIRKAGGKKVVFKRDA